MSYLIFIPYMGFSSKQNYGCHQTMVRDLKDTLLVMKWSAKQEIAQKMKFMLKQHVGMECYSVVDSIAMGNQEKGSFKSQFSWFLDTMMERLFRMVQLNLLTMLSNCGYSGVVWVFLFRKFDILL